MGGAPAYLTYANVPHGSAAGNVRREEKVESGGRLRHPALLPLELHPMSLTVAFVMDPMERINVRTDTSFAFMLAAQDRGHRVIHALPNEVSLDEGTVWLRGRHVRVRKQQGDHYEVVEAARVPARDIDAIFIRTDPPFDDHYLTVTWILSFAEAQGVRIINSPRGLREANEHLYSLYFPELCPDTVVSSARSEILAFVERVGTAIAKPIDGHAGFGVVRLQVGDSNLNALIDMLSLEGRKPLMAQAYLPEGREGDRRLFLIDGVLRGAVRRVPAAGDHRGNVHVGGTTEPSDLTEADRALEAAMGPRLRADGLFFAGIDVIGDKLIEVNVTSPTLVQELRDLGGPDLAAEVIAAVEASAARD